MSGVIDERGQQWEHCNGCAKFVKIQDLGYERPTPSFKYGRDLCPDCMDLSRRDPGCPIEPSEETKREMAEAAANAKAWVEEIMKGKQWAETEPGVWTLVDVN